MSSPTLDYNAGILLAAFITVIALLIGVSLAVWKGVQWWKGRRRVTNNKKILEDIEMEFATEDDDDELLTATATTHADDDWSCIDTHADASTHNSPGAALQPKSTSKSTPARSHPRVSNKDKGERMIDEDNDD